MIGGGEEKKPAQQQQPVGDDSSGGCCAVEGSRPVQDSSEQPDVPLLGHPA